MLRTIIAASIVALSIYAAPSAHAQPVNLACSFLAPGVNSDANGNSVITDCNAGGFPYTVPADATLCITHAFLSEKYAANPLHYWGKTFLGQGAVGSLMTGDEHTMYMTVGTVVSIPAHHPEITFNPPWPQGSGTVIKGEVNNGMFEDQWVFTLVQGFLVPAGNYCS